MLIWRILARLPSTISILILTRLPATSSTVVSMRAAYLPRAPYWSCRKDFTSSSTERSKVLPCARPTLRSDLLQVFGLDVLVALELEALDGRALVDHHDQRVAIAAQFHVAEEAGVVQRAHRFAHALRATGCRRC